jgi:hypothetical protein
LLCAGLLAAQSTTAVLTPDLNGRSVQSAIYTAGDGDRTELNQSINGRPVPLQKTETRTLSENANGKTTETIIRKYDATGQLVSTERVVVESQKRPNGAVVNATTYRSDINGQMREAERRTIESQAQGQVSTTDITVSRPGLSGSFDVAEKRNIVTIADGKTVHETEVVERPSEAGRFAPVAREVREQGTTDGKSTAITASYEPDYTGKMSLIRQQVATTTKAADGSMVTELDLYAPAAYGVARSGSDTPKLKEQNVIVRREKNGVVTETTTVSRPTLQDPNHLVASGPPSELVCTGKCAGPLQP